MLLPETSQVVLVLEEMLLEDEVPFRKHKQLAQLFPAVPQIFQNRLIKDCSLNLDRDSHYDVSNIP